MQATKFWRDCDSGCHGFEPHFSHHFLLESSLIKKIETAIDKKKLNDLQIIRFFRLQSSQSKAITLNILSIVFFSIMVIFIRKAAENLHILEVVY